MKTLTLILVALVFIALPANAERLDSVNGTAINNVSVRVWNSTGDLVADVTTFLNGSIPDLTLNTTGNPHTFYIYGSGYVPMNFTTNVTDQQNDNSSVWVITLKPELNYLIAIGLGILLVPIFLTYLATRFKKDKKTWQLLFLCLTILFIAVTIHITKMIMIEDGYGALGDVMGYATFASIIPLFFILTYTFFDFMKEHLDVKKYGKRK